MRSHLPPMFAVAAALGLFTAATVAAQENNRRGTPAPQPRPSTGPSTQDLIDRQQANEIYRLQLQRDQAERDRVNSINSQRQADYQAALARYQAEKARIDAEWADRRRRCAAGDVRYCD